MTAPDGGLLVAPENEDAVPWSSPEGAGIVSGWADAGSATGPGNGFWAAAAAGLDTLDAAMTPLDALGAAGVGYLIEHLWFLHEPLDALAGDPTQITAQSRTWQNVADELHALAEGHRGDVAAISGWDGDARDAYGTAAAAYADGLSGAAVVAGQLAELILGTGVLVATERALVRDLVAEFLWWVIEKILAGVVGAFFTAGAALVAVITWSVIEALGLAFDLSVRIARFLDDVHVASGTATQLADRFRQVGAAAAAAAPTVFDRGFDLAERIDDVGTQARDGTREVLRVADAATLLPVGTTARAHAELVSSDVAAAVTELGKQYTAQGDNQREWQRGPVP